MKGRKLAVITGASTGIGLEIAKVAAQDNYDLVVVADEPHILGVADELRQFGVEVHPVEADLSTLTGVEWLVEAIGDRPVDVLVANAGRGLGHAFLEQTVADWRRVIDTNIVGTLYLIQKIAPQMVARARGRILLTGSIAGFMPGTFQAVYNGSKAFIDNFAEALRQELKNTGVTVTCLMPGPTETEFFARADLLDTHVGKQQKADPAKVARDGFDAMLRGDSRIVSGWSNKLQVAAARILPAALTAKQHRRMAEPEDSG